MLKKRIIIAQLLLKNRLVKLNLLINLLMLETQ